MPTAAIARMAYMFMFLIVTAEDSYQTCSCIAPAISPIKSVAARLRRLQLTFAAQMFARLLLLPALCRPSMVRILHNTSDICLSVRSRAAARRRTFRNRNTFVPWPSILSRSCRRFWSLQVATPSQRIVCTKDGGNWSIAVLRNMVPFRRPTAGSLEHELAAARR